MSNNQTPPSSHSAAAHAYGSSAQQHTPDPREVEARALLKVTRSLQELQNAFDQASTEEMGQILKYNRQIWMMFYDTAVENNADGHSDELRSNIINLANFIFKREKEILVDPSADKLTALININQNIAAGLMGSPKKGA